MIGTRPRYVANIWLAAVPTAVTCSRVFVKHTLAQWGVPGLYDTAALVITELVTNAVKETGVMTPAPSWEEMEGLNIVDVRVLGFVDHVSIHVWDASLNPPVMSSTDPAGDAVGGRGLILVDEFSQHVGHFFPKTGGKVVYADLSLTNVATRLPQRAGKRHTTIDFPEADVALLRELLAGLSKL
ncbi:ATP-binding protein [Embleya sp. MST-111070]|uniref:ATP-binding protein n=1 Tax=Embleya sp. MST-111070 TaxID=3398231 RepID=UPI003F736C85